MGCHTWIHKDIEYLTDEEYKEDIVNEYLSNNITLQRYIKENDKDAFFRCKVDEVKQEMQNAISLGYDEYYVCKYFGGMTDEELYSKIKSKVEKDFAVYNRLCKGRIGKKEFFKLGLDKKHQYIFSTKNNRLYLYLRTAGVDIFRVSNYPSFEPTSYSALMRWLGKNGKRLHFKYYDDEKKDFVCQIDKKFRNKMKCLFKRFENHLLINFG